jgi:hypothetical protein
VIPGASHFDEERERTMVPTLSMNPQGAAGILPAVGVGRGLLASRRQHLATRFMAGEQVRKEQGAFHQPKRGDRGMGTKECEEGRRETPFLCPNSLVKTDGSSGGLVAERLDDGSRGLQPTVWRRRRRCRGATLDGFALLFSRRSATRSEPAVYPWAEAHGYRHFLAPRGTGGPCYGPQLSGDIP